MQVYIYLLRFKYEGTDEYTPGVLTTFYCPMSKGEEYVDSAGRVFEIVSIQHRLSQDPIVLLLEI